MTVPFENDYAQRLAAYVNSPPRLAQRRGADTPDLSASSGESSASDRMSPDTSVTDEFDRDNSPLIFPAETPFTQRPSVGGKQPKAQFLTMNRRLMEAEADEQEELGSQLRQFATEHGQQINASENTVAEACRFAMASTISINMHTSSFKIPDSRLHLSIKIYCFSITLQNYDRS